MANETRPMQDTGNPVLDSFVNFLMVRPGFDINQENLDILHGYLLKLAAKEPGGLKIKNGYTAIDVTLPPESA